MPSLHKSKTKMNHRKVFDDFDGIAQLVEQVAVNHRVAGSSPAHAVYCLQKGVYYEDVNDNASYDASRSGMW